ncbi:MAG: signal peptidase II [Alicyclobacillus herbarius]|uniref:signal peptidase II n=1 Tax=Alicyclobacillus herbarius TaxID=122960 RepID=UPI000416BD4E|nr:signal peptidase II [Alicyclobacillus herbarius]MCL6631669.1 signal peptidase II [Alicyclobacillus herbarius]
MWIYLTALAALIVDQGLKWDVRTHLQLGEGFPVLGDWVYIQYIRNPGGAFSIFPHAQWLFWLVAVLVIAVVIYVQLRHRPHRLLAVGLGLLMGGALGNLVDRVVSGSVVDYVYLKVINFPVFNFADVCIDAGIVLILWSMLRADRAKEEWSAEGEDSGRHS